MDDLRHEKVPFRRRNLVDLMQQANFPQVRPTLVALD